MTIPDSIALTLKLATARLAQLPGINARLEAEILLAHALDKPRTHLFTWPEKPVENSLRDRFEELLDRRLGGEPSAYLTGQREFWSLQLKVTSETLIPRPETELLVERALPLLPAERAAVIADLGTGSGAISAAIASECPACKIYATDISAAALAVAHENFDKLGLANVNCLRGHWCAALPMGMKFDLIVSNPPYLASDDPHLSEDGLPWEPVFALVSGAEGLNDIHAIISTAGAHLVAGGWLLLEHGCDQGAQVRRTFSEAGYQQCGTFRDLGGRERVTQGRMPT
ncbi:MAG: peptide chain release factor N(5)-glutamine methyltransferase [Gammaproteobacteria bacterium]|nr:peptide chain release factor N(5)-glutamine methyltransferase [Gammaproteobacteria bacterium]MCP5418452.1 peptide chain release factor N(5)-glutamine methyltransferase [Chromatiaceae bacterium]